ncbi:HAD family hydrolase [Mesobacillus sp. AQ2]|uniref:HAD family hydrolase n=1 Tax=Bacillaceae TaxID=186817 RepID=UPI0011A76841|nr:MULTISPECIES: HAD family hydrolase [Bacillaceae]MCM3125199.1 HAD family hydrolase [Mesobacillus sp. MER 33]MCM3235370.1 HAD family hydrolase [Mesobacillus sp. MER 48]WHX40954.1 HAD family hydrolase [Mesobacillus sp. AQ2]
MDSIIFDLDGTIWDPIDTVLSAWNSVIRKSNHLNSELTRKDFEGTMGLQMNEITRKFFPTLNDNERQEIIKDCCEVEHSVIEKSGGVLFDNVENVLKELSRKYKLFIVSNCQDGYIEAFYKYHRLDQYFLDFENPGRTGLSKGENIKLIIERNNLSNPVYVGDTQGDLDAARFANIPFIYAEYGFGQVSEYDMKVKSFEELLRLC